MRKRALMWVAGIALLVMIAGAAVSPPTYVIVAADQQSDRAILRVTYEQPRALRSFGGLYFARIDRVEGGAVIELYQSGRPVGHCNIGYFTHTDLQPHILSGDDCQNWDGRHMDEAG